MLHCCMLKIQGLWLRHAGTSWTIQAAEVDVAFLDAAEKDKFSDTMIASFPKYLAETNLFEFARADS